MPVIVLTKADLYPEDVDSAVAETEAVAFGVPVYAVSGITGEGVEALEPYLRPGTTVALLGSSGVGKSTLVNHLAGREVLETQDVRSDGRGRHTTSHRELVLFPGGTLLLDTPGMRELQLWEDRIGLDTSFADIVELAGQCRFSDCATQPEPGCAIKAALADGTLEQERWRSYQKLQRELRALEIRQDGRLRRRSGRRGHALQGAGARSSTNLRSLMSVATLATPKVSANGVVFAYPDADRELTGVRLVQEVQRPRVGPEFTRTPRGRTWRLTFPRPDVDRMEYLLELETDGTFETTLDPSNPLRAPGPWGDKSAIEFPGYEAPEWVGAEATLMFSPSLGEIRAGGARIGGLGFGGPPPPWVRGAGAGAAVAAVAVQAGVGLIPGIRRRMTGVRRRRAMLYLGGGAVAGATAGPWLVLVLLFCGALELVWERSASPNSAALTPGP